MDAGIVDPGNIGARAVPCLEFSASLSPLWRSDERTRTADLLQLRVCCSTAERSPHLSSTLSQDLSAGCHPRLAERGTLAQSMCSF
jgi:hypothetical protein